jgi:hypothetical protein
MSEPKSFGSVIDSAWDEVAKAEAPTKTEPAETVAEDKAEAAPKADPAPEAKVETKASNSAAEKLADEDLNLSAEEMAAVAADPKLSKIYKSMQRGLTAKTTSIAEERRKLAARQSILDQIEADPEQAAVALAKAAGLEVVRKNEAAQTAVDDASAKMAELFGPEAAGVLKPVFEQLVKGVLEQEVAPYKEATEQLQNTAFDQAMGAAVEQFKSSLNEELDPQTEQEMVALMAQIKPGKDVTPVQYLKFLHTNVTAGKVRAKATQEAADRIRKVASAQEPVAGVRAAREPETGVSIKKSFGDNFSSAFDEAVREVGRR